jgi:hypothetical protein
VDKTISQKRFCSKATTAQLQRSCWLCEIAFLKIRFVSAPSMFMNREKPCPQIIELLPNQPQAILE